MSQNRNLFQHGDIPLLYDISRKNGTLFQLSIPESIYQKLLEMAHPKHFHFGSSFHPEKIMGLMVIEFDLDNLDKEMHEGLCRLFDWLTYRNLAKEATDFYGNQLLAITMVRSSIAASFAPWTHSYFQDNDFSRQIFYKALEKTKKYYNSHFEKKRYEPTLNFFDGGFQLDLPGNGLWLSGTYKGEFSSHNCDHTIDQLTFLYWLVTLSDGLKKKLALSPP